MNKNSIPKAISIIIFSSGLMNVVSVFFPASIERIRFLNFILPIEVTNFSRTLVFLIGMALLYLAKGLWELRRRAWVLSTILIGSSLVLHLFKGLDFEEDFLLFLPLLLLLRYRRFFVIRSVTREHLLQTTLRIISILFFLFIYSVFGFYLLAGQFNHEVNLNNIAGDYEYSILGIGHDRLKPTTRLSRWFEDSISIVGLFSILSVLALAFKPLLDLDKPTDEEKDIFRKLCLLYSKNSFSYMGLLEDKKYFFNNNNSAALSYKVRNDTSIVLGDPLGSNSETITRLIKDFLEEEKSKGLKVTFFGISNECKEIYENLGMKLLKIGEEGIIYTNDFSLAGKNREDIRHGVSRMERENVIFKWCTLDEIPWTILKDVDNLYQEWIQTRKYEPLTYSFNYYPFPSEKEAYLLTAYSHEGNILTALSFYPYKNGKGISLDLMLKSKNAPNGCMEASIYKAVEYFKNKGAEEVCIGTAALLDLGPSESEESQLIKKTKQIIFEYFDQFYNFKSLAFFKIKFQPCWKSQYITYFNEASLPNILIGVIQAQTKDTVTQVLIKKLKPKVGNN